MNDHSTWAEDLEGYIHHQSLRSFSPLLPNDPFCREPEPTQPTAYNGAMTNNSTGYSNHFTDNEAMFWTPMFSMMPIPPPALSMPCFPMRSNSDPTPLPFSIEEEDESQSDSDSHSMALTTETVSTAGDFEPRSPGSHGAFGIHSRLFSPLRRSLSSLSRMYARHIHRLGENTSPRGKRLARALSLKKMSRKILNKNQQEL